MSWVYFMVLSIVTASDINLQPDPDGAKPESRIFGGDPISIDEAPHHVHLIVRWGFNNKPETYCGGTIYNEQHILTAAHCVYDAVAKRPANQVTAYLGKTRRSANDGKEIAIIVARIIYHPTFNQPGIYYNDIAVLRLPNCITYNAYMQPVAVTTGDPGKLKGSYTVTGFGETVKRYVDQPDGAAADVLQKADVTYISRQDCQGLYQQANTNLGAIYSPGAATGIMKPMPTAIAATVFCTTTIPEGPCAGDSGGGFICQFPKTKKKELCGIVSGGVGCGLGVGEFITDIWQFKGWIVTETTTGAGLLNCPNGWDLSRPSTRRPSRSRDLPHKNPEGWNSFNQSSTPTCQCTCQGLQ